MGKNKRGRLAGASTKKHKPALKSKVEKAIKLKSQISGCAKPGVKKSDKEIAPPVKARKQAQHSEPTIPFDKDDRILLIGDGDLSFARSMVEAHDVQKLVATVLEKDQKVLEEKYPHAVENLEVLNDAGEDVKVVYNIDATKMGIWNANGDVGRGKGRKGGMNRIIFNFPHVGGKSTDVNRQVRYNQELLVNFFKCAIPSLAPKGSIVVTLFDGMPYSLWNIRDLARHSELAVERSFKFQAQAYPVYTHARTIGVVQNKKGGDAESAWKGEERPSRSFVFVRKEDMESKKGTRQEVVDGKPTKMTKMKGERESEAEDSEDEDMGTWNEDEVTKEEAEEIKRYEKAAKEDEWNLKEKGMFQ